MSVGDAMTLAVAAIIVVLGGRAVFQQTWDSWIRPLVSNISRPAQPEIMSHERLSAPSEPSVSQTDAQIEAPKPAAQPAIKAVTLDTVKSLREHKYSRDEARELLRGLGYSLDNNLWAKAAPAQADDDTIVTPYAGRVTSKKYYPDQPDLEYQELKS